MIKLQYITYRIKNIWSRIQIRKMINNYKMNKMNNLTLTKNNNLKTIASNNLIIL